MDFFLWGLRLLPWNNSSTSFSVYFYLGDYVYLKIVNYLPVKSLKLKMTLNSDIQEGPSPEPPSSLSSAPRRGLTCAVGKAMAREGQQEHRKGGGVPGPLWGQLETCCAYGVSDLNSYPSSAPASCVTLHEAPSLSDGRYPLKANRVNNHIRPSLGAWEGGGVKVVCGLDPHNSSIYCHLRSDAEGPREEEKVKDVGTRPGWWLSRLKCRSVH